MLHAGQLRLQPHRPAPSFPERRAVQARGSLWSEAYAQHDGARLGNRLAGSTSPNRADSIWSLVTQRSIARWSFRVLSWWDSPQPWLTSRREQAVARQRSARGRCDRRRKETVVCSDQEVCSFADTSLGLSANRPSSGRDWVFIFPVASTRWILPWPRQCRYGQQSPC
jgi:hypothetical protein